MSRRTLTSPKVVSKISATASNMLLDGSAATGAVSADTSDTLTSGTKVNKANRVWQWKHTTGHRKQIASGANVVIDLYDFAGFDAGAGDGADPVGQALTLEEIVAIKIKNENAVTEAGQLEIEPDATNGWTPIGTHTVATGGALKGGGFLMKYQPASTAFDVTDASSHRLKLTANGGRVYYSVWVMGRSDEESSSSSSSSSESSSSVSSSSSSSVTSSGSSSSQSSSSVSSSSQSSSSSVTSSSSSSSVTSSSSASSASSQSSVSSSSQ